MTRASSNRKHSTGNTAANSRPGPVFKGRDVVFVDPLDEKESYWWPAMIVPVPEIDSSMECTVLNPGECLVKYFEDNKYSVVPFSDLQHFKPTTIPFLEFELAAGQKFLKNGGVINAMSYIESGKVKRRFSWNRWGSAQDQDLNLDMQRSKAINLPLISDEEYLGSQPQAQAGIHSQSSSAASSPAISTKDDTDIESGSNDPLITQSQSVSGPLSGSSLSMPLTPSSSASSSLAPSVNTTTTTAATAAAGSALKNGMQRPVAGRGVSSQQQQTSTVGNTTLLPSPVSLQDLATVEPMDEIELDARSTKSKTEGTATKDSPTVGRSRSRRGSREVDPKTSSSSPAIATASVSATSLSATSAFSSLKTTAAADKKENSKRSRNVSEQPSSSPSTSSSGSSSGSHAGTTTSTEPGVTSGSGEGIKKRKTGTEPSISTDSQSAAQESNVVSIRASRQGSAEPSTSPRSTRHSSRHSKAPENNQQAGQGEPRPESPVEPTVSTRLPTHRMTRQRSMPKSANSLPPPAPATTVQATSSETEQTFNMTDVKEGEALITEETTKKEDADGTKPMTGVVTAEEESTAMDVDEPELKSTRNQGRGREKSASMPPSSLVSTTASSVTSSPASMGPDDGQMLSSASTTSSTTSTNGRLQSLVLDRQEVDRGFAIVLPTLAIGSKEREAFYENIMDHMQKLRQEHRRLKEVLKSSEYVPKGRRATRSSPQYHAHHHHHRHHHHRRQSPAEEKQNHRNESPALSKSSSANTPNPNNGNSSSSSSSSNKENQSAQSSKASAAAASAAAAKAEAAAAKAEAVSATGAPTFYQGSTPSSAILTSNISTTTRRSAATAAAAAVTATVSRASRQSHHSSGSNGSNGDKEPKRRGGAAASAAANAAAAAAAAITGDGGSITTRAKRRLR